MRKALADERMPELLRLSEDENGALWVKVHFLNHDGTIHPFRARSEDITKLIVGGRFAKHLYMDDWKCFVEKYEIDPARNVLVIHAKTARSSLPSLKRQNYRRATAVVVRNGRLLLVRERGGQAFSLPGGRARKGEPAVAAAVRELAEELGMHARSAQRLFECDYAGKGANHKVVLIETDDSPKIRSAEIDEFLWWNGKIRIPLLDHVRHIGWALSSWTDFQMETP